MDEQDKRTLSQVGTADVCLAAAWREFSRALAKEDVSIAFGVIREMLSAIEYVHRTAEQVAAILSEERSAAITAAVHPEGSE